MSKAVLDRKFLEILSIYFLTGTVRTYVRTLNGFFFRSFLMLFPLENKTISTNFANISITKVTSKINIKNCVSMTPIFF